MASTTWTSPLASKRLVPAVPFESPCQSHAPFTPVAACPVFRAPGRLIPKVPLAPGFDDTLILTTRHRKVCFRSSLWHIPAQVVPTPCPQRSPPLLLTTAAWGGLTPTPESRCRWASHHLSNSFHMIVRSLLLSSYVSAAHSGARSSIGCSATSRRTGVAGRWKAAWRWSN